MKSMTRPPADLTPPNLPLERGGTRRPNAPPGHPLFGHLPALQRDPLCFLTACARGYGAVVPLRLPFVRAFLLLEADDIERVLVTDHRNFIKPLWLRTPAVRRLLGDGLVTSDGDRWKRQRGTCRPAFLPGRMEGYSETMASLTERKLDQWIPIQSRDIQQDLTALTLEIIGRTLLGTDIADETTEISGCMLTMMECFTARHTLFGLIPLPPSPREARALRRLNGLVDRIIARSQIGNAEGAGQTMLANLCEHATAERLSAPAESNRAFHVREQVKTFLAAGHESSALTLAWALVLLAQNSDADARLAKELQSVLKGRAPAPSDLPNLPFTDAVIKEALRLYPPLWMTGRTLRTASEIGGQKMPEGALLLTSQWAVQRSPRYFPDPDEFRPERWLDPEMATLPKYAYFPFGGGPRICIGQGFAGMETVLILAAVTRRFRLELDSDPNPTPWATMTLRPPAALRMRPIARAGFEPQV